MMSGHDGQELYGGRPMLQKLDTGDNEVLSRRTQILPAYIKKLDSELVTVVAFLGTRC